MWIKYVDIIFLTLCMSEKDKGRNDKGGVCAWKSRMEDRATAADEDKLSALHLLINHEAHTFTVNLC